MSLYSNMIEVSLAEIARLSFYEVKNGERVLVTEVAVPLDVFNQLPVTIEKTIKHHKENNTLK